MYRPDFADYTPWKSEHLPMDGRAIQCIGWLDKTVPFTVGSTPALFLEHLRQHCLHGVFRINLGVAVCSLCGDGQTPLVLRRNEQSFPWVNGEIFVVHGDLIYVAPTAILHYVEAHGYRPPDVFVEAVIHGPLPTSIEHQEIMRAMRMEAFSVDAPVQ